MDGDDVVSLVEEVSRPSYVITSRYWVLPIVPLLQLGWVRDQPYVYPHVTGEPSQLRQEF